MKQIGILFKRSFSPVTIMVVPHENLKCLNLRIPAIGLLCFILFSTVGMTCLSFLAVSGVRNEAQRHSMAEKLAFYSEQFYRWDSTVTALNKVEKEFRQLFALESKDKVLENVDTSFSGSLDISNLVEELKTTTETVDGIKDYLRIEKDVYFSTPKGYPVLGDITSNYGQRKDPFSGERHFHSGVDISSSPGNPVRATADAIVSHSGWTPENGFLVVLEHGHGFSTFYAHNRRNVVTIGQKVKAGDVIAYVGSTGKSTGPHVHYEVWKDGKSVDPMQYIHRRS